MSAKSFPVIVLCLWAGVLAITPPLTTIGAASEAKWPTLGGGYTRSGASPYEGLAEGGGAWVREIGGAAIGSVTVGFDGRVHAACEDGKLYTFDANGLDLWIIDVNAPLLSAPSIGPDGSLFVGGQDGKLRAISPDGALRWTFGAGDLVYSSPAVTPDGAVYFGSADGTLYALDADGSELWQFKTKGPGRLPSGAIFASPSLAADGTVYVGGLYDPNLYALDPADGTVKWVCNFALYPENESDPNSAKTGGWPFAAAVVGEGGTIYQTLLYDSHLYAVNPNDGTLLWATDLLDCPAINPEAEDFLPDADGWSEPVLAPDGTIYVSLDDPYLRAVDPNGAIKWATRLGDVGAFTLTTDKNGWVYAACDDGYVYVVDPDGLQIGRWETAGWPAYPVIASDGTLLVTDTQDYSMLATDLKNAVLALSVDSLQDPAPEPEPEPDPEPDPNVIKR